MLLAFLYEIRWKGFFGNHVYLSIFHDKVSAMKLFIGFSLNLV
jgi:hypothetical protein